MAEVNEEQAPIWKDLGPEQLHNNSVFFKPPPSTKTTEVIDAMTSSGYDDLLSVQISVKKCILTFLSRENAEAIVEHGMDLGGVSYSLCLVSESRNQEDQSPEKVPMPTLESFQLLFRKSLLISIVLQN